MLNDIDNINRSTWAAPNGDQWVFHSEATGEHAAIADVFSASGELIGRVMPLAGSRVVGFGAERVYLVRAGERSAA